MHGSSEEKKLLIESMKKLVTYPWDKLVMCLIIRNVNEKSSMLSPCRTLIRSFLTCEMIMNIYAGSLLYCCVNFFIKIKRQSKEPFGCQVFSHLSVVYASVDLGLLERYTRIYPQISFDTQEYVYSKQECIELMQTPVTEEEQERICWIINLERKTLKLECLEYKKYSSFTFIDPLKNIFGFVNIDPNNIRKEPKDIQVSVQRARDVEGRSVTSSLNQSTQLSSQFYKNYLESRNQSKDSKRGSFNSNYVNLSVDLGETARPGFTRPITSRQNTNYTSRQEPNTLFNQNEIRANTIHNISQYARNSYNPKLNRSTYEPPHRHQQEKQVLTDRKLDIEARKSGNTSPMVTNHEKFYKRVKEILKK